MPIDERLKIALIIVALVTLESVAISSVMAQGSIFGAVKNSDQTIPANGEINFFGYIGGNDNEIRTESSIGAGYDNGNWFDDFQNYLDESADQPYQYRFFNINNGEGFVLDGLIPNNSFQQEDIELATVDWPSTVENLYALVPNNGKVLLGWNTLPDHTYHIYRRLAISAGSFYRIDDPSGNLSNPGVECGFYIDDEVDGTNNYDYLFIAQNAAGTLGTHSEIVSVNSSMVMAPVIVAIMPASGPVSGGTEVTISGSGFDPDGVIVAIGAGYLSDVVIVSPFEITGRTPPGTQGAVDIYVTNTASGLSSNIFVGGYMYLGSQNVPPVLYGTSDKNGLIEQLLVFKVFAVDTDGDEVFISGRKFPDGAVLTYNGYNIDNGFYEATFAWTPKTIHAGLHDSLEILAHDLLDTTIVIMPVKIFDNGYVCGDADGNWIYNVLDIIYLISYIYNDPPGPPPVPLAAGDANGDGIINLKDILRLIAFLYDDPRGPAPVCP